MIVRNLSSSEEDCTDEWERFDKVSNKAYAELERAAVRLNHSISEQGRLQRERIAELEKEKASLDKTAESKARAKAIDKEIKELRKDVVSGTDEELQAQLKMNREARGRLKLLKQESKAQKEQGKQQKTLLQLIKEDLKPLKEKIALQKEFIKSLRDTEGRYNALKRVAKGAMSVGGAALKGAGESDESGCQGSWRNS